MATERQVQALKPGQTVTVKIRGVDTEAIFLAIMGEYAQVATGTGPDGTALARITSLQNLVLPEPPQAKPGVLYCRTRVTSTGRLLDRRMGTHDGRLWAHMFPELVDYDDTWEELDKVQGWLQ